MSGPKRIAELHDDPAETPGEHRNVRTEHHWRFRAERRLMFELGERHNLIDLLWALVG